MISLDTTNLYLVSKNAKPLSNLTIYAEGIPYSILVKGKKTKLAELFVDFKEDYSSVRVKGEFNNWDASQTELIKSDHNHWIAQFNVKPGKYQYKLVADGKEIDDPSNPIKVSNGMGGLNNVLEVSGPPKELIPSIVTESFQPMKS